MGDSEVLNTGLILKGFEDFFMALSMFYYIARHGRQDMKNTTTKRGLYLVEQTCDTQVG